MLRRERKRRDEAARGFREGGREDDAPQPRRPRPALIDAFLPAEMDEAELAAIVDAAIAEAGRHVAARAGRRDELVMARTEGPAPTARRVSALVRGRLGG